MLWRRRLSRVLSLAILAAPAGPACASDLSSQVNGLVSSSKLGKANVGVSIVECVAPSGTDPVLVGINESTPFIPASNLKVITTAAALEVLGADFTFETHLILSKTPTGHRLTLVGSGDPALFDPEAREADGRHGNWTTVEQCARSWAESLKGAGIAQVEEFVVDGRIFDTESTPQGDTKWRNNEHAGTYAVGVWGLNIAANAAVLKPSWNPGGAPAIGSVDPPFPLRIAGGKNTATCDARRAENLSIAYEADRRSLRFSGNMRQRTTEVSLGIHDPLPLSAEMFARLLAANGVEVRSWRVATQQDPAAIGPSVEPVLRTPIATVLKGANTESKNLYAEALLKRLGAKSANPPSRPIGPEFVAGSWTNGNGALRAALDKRLGSGCTGALCMRDGSGLSDVNRTTPDLTARLLATYAADQAYFRPYFMSFARPRQPGTLMKRFASVDLRGAEVFAKSGYIDGACCLSGIVIGAGGRTVAFSVLCNKVSDGEIAEAKSLHERIVAAIAREIAPAQVRTAQGG